MDPSRTQVFPFKNLGTSTATLTNSFTANVYGIDAKATDHVDKVIPLNTPVKLARLLAAGKYDFPSAEGVITANGSPLDKITVSVSSGSLAIGSSYGILYEIPNFPSNNGVDRIAAVPIQPAVKGGAYLVFLKLLDKSLNPGNFSSSSSIYEAAYGTFHLTPDRISLYVGLYPPHTAGYSSDQILTTEGTPIQANTAVTVLTNRGSFTPVDFNGLAGDGHQIGADASGRLYFGLQATGLNTGIANVRAVLGLASGTDSSVNFVQIPQFSAAFSAEELNITAATPNPKTVCTTSAIGSAGNLIPDNTAVNVFADLGVLAPADFYPTEANHQVKTLSGVATFELSSSNAGIASLTIECGGRIVNRNIVFLDRYPPNPPGKPSLDNSLNNNGVFTLSWAAATDPANSGVDTYNIQYSLNNGPYIDLATPTTTSYITSNLAQGIYRFKVRAIDGAGNIGAFSIPGDPVEVDKTPPIGSIIIDGGALRTSSLNVTLALNATDDKGVGSMCFSNDGVDFSAWIPYATSQAWTLSAGDENKIVYVRFRDNVGNIATLFDVIQLDTLPPTGSVSIAPSPYSNLTSLNVTIMPDDASPVNSMQVSKDGAAWESVAFSSLIVWAVPTTFATHTVKIRLIDVLGNTSPDISASTCVDTQTPGAPTAVTDDGDYSPYLDKLHVSWSGASDGQSGISHYLVRIGKTAGAADVMAETNVGLVSEGLYGPFVPALDITGATVYFFSVIAVDRAGNLSVVAGSNGIKGGDPTPPSAPVVSDSGQFTADKTQISATWTDAVDTDSGIARYEVSIGTSIGGIQVMNWINNGMNKFYTKTGLDLAHNTQYFVNVRSYNGGGTYIDASTDGLIVDLVAPVAPTMSAEPVSGYTSGTVNIVGCSTVSDPVSGGVNYFFECSADSGFGSLFSSSAWKTETSHTFTGLVNGTHYYFRVKARDAVLNVGSYSAAVNSIQDSFAPTATNYTDNVPENNDPDHFWSRDAIVSFAATGLTDNLSGIKNVYVEIDDDIAFTPPLLGEGWTGNITGQKTFTVAPAADGNVIYARARYEDIAGNITTTAATQTTDGITLDLVNPIAGATTDNVPDNDDRDHQVSSDSWIYFGFTHSDNVSGVSDVHIQLAKDAAFTQIATSTLIGSTISPYLYKLGEDGQTYYARIRVVDKSGRYSDDTLTFAAATGFGTPSDGIRVDLTPPAPSAETFYINKKADAFIGEETTATSVVYLTFTVSDPSGIAKAEVSNNGIVWVTLTDPLLDPASHPWVLDLTPGVKTVSVILTDGLGHATALTQKTIEFWPLYKVFVGTRDDRSYPVDTYDEYYGQNKYGAPRKDAGAPGLGSSLRLVKP